MDALLLRIVLVCVMKKAIWIAVPVGVLVGAWWMFGRGGNGDQEIEYRYAKVEKGTITRSISATGLIVALTTVDVKSKAGGKVVRLAVDEGSVVKKGDLLAEIDPSDTQASYQQADADLRSAQARAAQAKVNYELTVAQSKTAVSDAQAALDAARSRLAAMELEVKRQPAISSSQLAAAQAAYDSALQALEKYRSVTAPQLRKDSAGSLASSEANLTASRRALERQRELLSLGFTSQAAVEQAEANYQAAEAQHNVAKQRAETLNREIETSLKAQELSVEQARASLTQARANQSQIPISQEDLRQARIAVRQAEINLQKARDAERNNAIRRSEVAAAVASTTRSRVSVENAKVQLDSTTVVAPRDGVVTLKYLEEGTIIPPGTSTFSQGTSLVQLSDVTQLFVECAVDEADIGSVQVNQRVRITAEAFPGQPFEGVVARISPAATTANNITAVKVRVKVLPGAKARVLPGMNANCEFITLEKKNVLIVPSQAVKTRDGKSYVKVKPAKEGLPPLEKDVQVGESGNDGIEVISGLSEGEEVVTAEINLAELRKIQEQMTQAQQGGGLAGGNTGPRMQSRSTAGGGSGGGSRGAGGGR